MKSRWFSDIVCVVWIILCCASVVATILAINTICQEFNVPILLRVMWLMMSFVSCLSAISKGTEKIESHLLNDRS